MPKIIVLFCFVLFSFHLNADEKSDEALSVELPALSAIRGQTSLSGLSSGAFMAAQYHVAYSKDLVGVGLVAGGLWNCAESRSGAISPFINAISTCMDPCKYSWFGCSNSLFPDAQRVYDLAIREAEAGTIDPISYLKDDSVYLFSGTHDETVVTGVVDKTYEFYRLLGLSDDAIKFNKTVDAGHAFITADIDDSSCSLTQSPYINNCGFEQAEKILAHIYGSLNAADGHLSGELIRFDQRPFIQGSQSSMDDSGYVYVPNACQSGRCKVHVALHGCRQGISVVGTTFVVGAGYNEVADNNDIIVLYPQVRKSSLWPVNPRGCWDFWGYTGSNLPPYEYYKQSAPQMKAISLMLERLISVPSEKLTVDRVRSESLN